MSSTRILGIDYGSKRVGVAVSDESQKFALPEVVLPNTHELILKVEEIAKKYGTKEIILGESRNYKMEPNDIMADVHIFKEKLEADGYTVKFEEEFMTSQQAEKLQGKNPKIDASAAALILQSYLDKKIARKTANNNLLYCVL